MTWPRCFSSTINVLGAAVRRRAAGCGAVPRHLRGVRLENVRFTVTAPDARPFVAGDDIDGLALQNVVGSGPTSASGLAKLADAHGVTTQDCRVEPGDNVPVLVPPTADEERRLADLRVRVRRSTRQSKGPPMQAESIRSNRLHRSKQRTDGLKGEVNTATRIPAPLRPLGRGHGRQPSLGAGGLCGRREKGVSKASPSTDDRQLLVGLGVDFGWGREQLVFP